MTSCDSVEGRRAEREHFAIEACRHQYGDEPPVVSTGEYWQWACAVYGEPIGVSPIECPSEGCTGVSLQRVERYEYTPHGPLPTYALPATAEVMPGPAGHITGHDPGWTLADIAAKRRIIELYRIADKDDTYSAEARAMLRCAVATIAAIDAGPPDYDPDWSQ